MLSTVKASEAWKPDREEGQAFSSSSLDSYKVLVLSHSYEPIHFCSARRAVTMILSGRAENVESDGLPIRSPSLTIMMPAVIRTAHFVRRPYRHRISFSKRNVFRRDNYTCQYCGRSGRDLTVDHVIPKSRGGRTGWENMVVACKRCNLRKGNRTLIESGLSLLRPPREPRVPLFYANPSLVPRSLWESWKKYLYSKSSPC